MLKEMTVQWKMVFKLKGVREGFSIKKDTQAVDVSTAMTGNVDV